MTESLRPMKQLQDVLEDEDLRARIVGASTEGEVAHLLKEAGIAKGYWFSDVWLSEVFVDVKVARAPAAFSEDELMQLASTRIWSDTPPRLCHTDSCGGHPAQCCISWA